MRGQRLLQECWHRAQPLALVLSYTGIGSAGSESFAGVLTQCASLAYLNLSSKAEIRKDIHISQIQYNEGNTFEEMLVDSMLIHLYASMI